MSYMIIKNRNIKYTKMMNATPGVAAKVE
jgi:hypothetical protein